MQLMKNIDGILTPITLEEIAAQRECLIELRNAALDAGDFSKAVTLSHTIATLHALSTAMESQ